MSRIKIKNIGPIVDVEMELNKVNVIMGPQSSGKSTIAKLISYCRWVEKYVATSQSLKVDGNLFKEYLETFHKMKGYFNSDSFISYKSDVIDILYDSGKFSLDWVDRYAYKRSKISYIPSERNLITLHEIEKVEFSHSNIRSFLFDLFEARKNYSSKNRLSVLNLGVDYYYNADTRESHIYRKNNTEQYDILLATASSGLQSIIPLIITIDYLTEWFYKQENTIINFERQEEEAKTAIFLLKEKVVKPYFKINSEITNEQLNEYAIQISKAIDLKEEKIIPLMQNYSDLRKNLFSSHNSQFIIEEPEQNLFPETQRDLIYYLLEKCLDSERDHQLTITTHSPYILYAINNCIMKNIVQDKLKDRDKSRLNTNLSAIDPKTVSIYEINAGELKKIQQEDGLIEANYFDNNMKEQMDDFYIMLNYYEND
jgi:predicted ATPase